jgi:hypothetical protein
MSGQLWRRERRARAEQFLDNAEALFVSLSAILGRFPKSFSFFCPIEVEVFLADSSVETLSEQGKER